MRRTTKWFSAALAVALGCPAFSHAQAIWTPTNPNTWAPGAYRPQNELPFSEKYNYYSGPALYFGMTGRQAHYLEYLDRVDRAERFCRPIPPPPKYLVEPPRRHFWTKRQAPPPPPVVEEGIELAPTPQQLRLSEIK